MLKLIVLFLLTFNPVNCCAPLNSLEISISNLSRFICDAVSEISNHGIGSVAIVNHGENSKSRIFDDLAKCMPTNVTMIRLDLTKEYKNMELNHVKFISMIGDEVEKNRFIDLVDDRKLKPKPLFSNTAKFLFICTALSCSTKELSETLPKNGILNFAFTSEDENGDINVEVSNNFANTTNIYKNVRKENIVATLYPNKLKNMHRTLINVLAHKKLPNVMIKGDKVISVNNYLFGYLAETLNFTYKPHIVNAKGSFQLMDDFMELFVTRKIDTTLSTIPPILTGTPKVISYIENGFCALIPINVVSSFNLGPILNSFDKAGKILVSIMAAFYMMFWLIYKSRGEAQGSPWNLVFGCFAIFVGQGFKLRTSKMIMKLLFMSFVFASIIMSNYFQAFFTREVTMPLPGHRIETISELFERPNQINLGIGTHQIISFIPEYQTAYEDGRVFVVPVGQNLDFKTVLIYGCGSLQLLIETEKLENYYYFPDRLVTVYTTHDMGFMSPYAEIFQELITNAFSVGLYQAWEIFFEVENLRTPEDHNNHEGTSLLTFKDLKRIFIIFPIGILVATFILLFEIFHYGFWSRFTWQSTMEKIAWKKKKNILKVKRIQVQAINVEESEM